MAPATDFANTSPVRRLWIGIAFITVFLGAGCTQIRAFRKGDDRPVFGTETADSSKASGVRGSSGDVYVDRLRQTGPAKASLAQRSKSSSSSMRGEDPPDPILDPGPQVVLLPPVSIPSPNGSNEAPAAEPVEALPELRASTTRLDPEPRAPRIERAAIESVPGTLRASQTSLAGLLTESRQRLEGLTSYQVMMSHRERVGMVLNPAEDVLLSVRRSPKAVRLEWPTGPNKGREVIYEPGRNAQMQIYMPGALVPRVPMKPDSFLAMRNSRHPISEAGFHTILQNMELALEGEGTENPAHGQLRYMGLEQPEGLDAPAQDRSDHCYSGNLARLPRSPIPPPDPGSGHGRQRRPARALCLPRPEDRRFRARLRAGLRPRRPMGSAQKPPATTRPRRGRCPETDRVSLTCCLPNWRPFNGF